MPKEQVPGKPQTRRYTPEAKAAAVRMVRTLRAELGTEHGTVQRGSDPVGLRGGVGAAVGQTGRHRRRPRAGGDHLGGQADQGDRRRLMSYLVGRAQRR